MKSLGISVSETAVIYGIFPPFAILAPSAMGMAADKLGNFKVPYLNKYLSFKITAGFYSKLGFRMLKCTPLKFIFQKVWNMIRFYLNQCYVRHRMGLSPTRSLSFLLFLIWASLRRTRSGSNRGEI